MSQQKSFIKLKGRSGGLTFFQNEKGDSARQATGIDGNRIRSGEAFARTRENMAEFGRAGKAGKLLRAALLDHIVRTADPRMQGRITQAFMGVIRTDSVNGRGERRISDGNVGLMAGFQFNKAADLAQSLRVPVTSTIDRASGKCTVEVPSFVPALKLSIPDGATHFQLLSGAAAVDFDEEKQVAVLSESDILPLTSDVQPAMTLTQTIAGAVHPLFLSLGIEFLQVVNGRKYTLKSSGHNALALIQIDDGA